MANIHSGKSISQQTPLLIFIPLGLAAFFAPLAYGLPVFYQTDFLTAAGFAVFLAGFVCFRKQFRITPDKFGALMLLFLLFTALQYFCSTWKISGHTMPSSFYAYATRTQLVQFVSGYLFYLAIVGSSGKERTFTKLIIICILMAGYAASLSTLRRQFLGHSPDADAQQFFSWLEYFPQVHPNRNNAAAFLEMVMPVALGFGFYRFFHVADESRGEPAKFIRKLSASGSLMLSFFLVFLIICAAVATLSRFSIVALGFGILVFTMLAGQSMQRRGVILAVLILMALSALLAVWLAGEPFGERLSSTTPEAWLSLNQRIPFWKRALPIFRAFPVFGTGLGTFSASLVSFHRVESDYLSAHLLNDHLELLIETGLAGFLLWFFAWISFFAASARKILSERSYFRKFVGAGLISGLLSFFLHQFLISGFYDGAGCFYLFLFAGLGHVVVNEQERSADDSVSVRTQGLGRSLYFAAVIVLALLSLVFFLRAQLANAFLGKHPIEMSYKRAAGVDSQNAEYAFTLAKIQTDKAKRMEDAPRRIQKINDSLLWMARAIDLNPYHLSYRTHYANLAAQADRMEEGRAVYQLMVGRLPFDVELLLTSAIYELTCAHLARQKGNVSLENACRKRANELIERARSLDLDFANAIYQRKLLALPTDLKHFIESASAPQS